MQCGEKFVNLASNVSKWPRLIVSYRAYVFVFVMVLQYLRKYLANKTARDSLNYCLNLSIGTLAFVGSMSDVFDAILCKI
jgi:hypothetical protein